MIKNDIRYIIKRVITAIIISLILMFIGSLKVKALTYTINDSSLPPYIDINGSILGSVYFSSGRFTSSGSGYLLFSFAVGSATNGNVDGITEVIAYKKNGNTSTPYVCDIGNGTWYTDNQEQRIIYSVNCPMDLNNNEYLSHLGFYRGSATGRIFVYLPNFFSYTAEVSDANNIINSNNQNIQQQIQNDNTNTQSLMNGMAYVNNTIIEQGNRAHQDAQDIKDAIIDDSAPNQNDIGNNTNDWSSNNANNGVINQLLTMPITLINSIVNGLSNSCSPYNIGSLFGTDLLLPCVNMSNILGSLWTLIDVIISGIFIFLFGGKCVRIFNDFTNLKGGQVDTLYGGGN